MFIDKTVIHVKAGDGGNGAVSFHREKYVASGGPDGGDGGRGGNVVLMVREGSDTLVDFRYKRKFAAGNGENGAAKRCSGKAGADCIIYVPRGTLVFDNVSGRLMADLSGDEPFIAARGGRGGWGNSHFATPTRQAPRFSKPGQPGEALELRLELKLLADVALIGFPNAGKSTLISVVSQAKPQIASYPFTTLTPVLGVVSIGPGQSFVMADIPGLIEGAGDGVGLGHDFLRHVERCRLLVHVVDVSGSEGRDPLEDFAIINRELRRFNENLAELPMIVAGNKCDLATDEQLERFESAMKEMGYAYFPMMAAIAHGTQELVQYTAAKLQTLPPVRVFEPEAVPLVLPEERETTVVREGDVWNVRADWLPPLLRTTNLDDPEGLQYFERLLESSGVIAALRDAGVATGDTVRLYNMEFEFL